MITAAELQVLVSVEDVDEAVRALQQFEKEGDMAKKSGGGHGSSIKNPATYEALLREGMSKEKAATISNGLLKHGVKKGTHHRGKK